ncbi:arginine-tRNA-protein transferase [Ectothiorhodospira magna]|uniref:Aspartate/glutamate leucyltransferase n=1 Tax=Ectothiorhodospira magna TaxID=867345 RepID=A0A1H9BQA6_9GAMM|nr:arginyltransferase [Ectothiorhodospira magna]SEP91085.1 arginine-tRNA-protein transferase [Ectothiorhodospira magna]
MRTDTVSRHASLIFYATTPDDCPYLRERRMVSLFADPEGPMDTALYGNLLQHGFRRSGNHVYRHQCPQCRACIPYRVPVAGFNPDRGQRRVLKRNAGIAATIRDAAFDPVHYRLYAAYVNQRHRGGGMDNPTPDSYLGFVTSQWCRTWLVEFREQDALLGVAVVDRLPDALSAVYTFFDPAAQARSLGTLAVLWQIQRAREEGLTHVYLGYWNPGSRKMAYKNRFRPGERLVNGIWTAAVT